MKNRLATFLVKGRYKNKKGNKIELHFAIKANDKESAIQKIKNTNFSSSERLSVFSNKNLNLDLRTLKEYDYTYVTNIVAFL